RRWVGRRWTSRWRRRERWCQGRRSRARGRSGRRRRRRGRSRRAARDPGRSRGGGLLGLAPVGAAGKALAVVAPAGRARVGAGEPAQAGAGLVGEATARELLEVGAQELAVAVVVAAPAGDQPAVGEGVLDGRAPPAEGDHLAVARVGLVEGAVPQERLGLVVEPG